MKKKRVFSKERSLWRRLRGWMMEYADLVTLGAVIAVIVAGAMYTGQVRKESELQAAAGAPEIQASASPAALPDAEITPLPTIAPLQVHYEALSTPAGTVWPVGGQVVRGYDAQKPVLWEALSCIQVHAGLDIVGEEGESVRCAMDGVVSKVVRDELWGWRVCVVHMDGSETVYAGLESCDVAAGQAVTRGQQLGILLGAIPCEAELGAHLHMELRENGALYDPEEALPERTLSERTFPER